MISFFKTIENNTIIIQKPMADSEPFEKEIRGICCKECLKEITSEDFYFEKNNFHTHSFSNPYGYIFTIRCFSKAPGIISTGPYSNEFSWFKDYYWQIALCSKCKTHLGWKFSDSESYFFGLITERIV